MFSGNWLRWVINHEESNKSTGPPESSWQGPERYLIISSISLNNYLLSTIEMSLSDISITIKYEMKIKIITPIEHLVCNQLNENSQRCLDLKLEV